MMFTKKMRLETGEAGFTFVEMMIVISLIAIISAISYPSFISMRGNYRLKAAAREVFNVLQTNKMRAVKESMVIAVIFSDVTNTYKVCLSRNGDWTATPADCGDPISLDSAVSFDRGASLTRPNNTTSTTDVEYSSGVAGFFQDGTGFEGDQTRINGVRYVYISSLNSPDVFAVGTNRVGLVQLYVWTGGASWR
ncbi:MAG: prepilin-type N-terminal cleavage/methylation domain-containing protein [Desulfobulbaceae bacterium]|nr:prepilin-type N-terminal cleavage/methylation domain-containing protein [Desulfobulbaceae bacterium]